MKIIKFKNGNVNLQLEPEYDKSPYSDYSLDNILNNSDMFMDNLVFKVDAEGALWIIDYEKNLAYVVSTTMFSPNYWKSYNFFEDLLNGKTIKLTPYGTIDEIREFFNEDEL